MLSKCFTNDKAPFSQEPRTFHSIQIIAAAVPPAQLGSTGEVGVVEDSASPRSEVTCQPEISRRLFRLIKSENNLVGAHEAAAEGASVNRDAAVGMGRADQR